MKIKYYIKNVEGLVLPKRANETDAGYDVVATSGPKIVGDPLNGPSYRRIDYIEYETNLYIAPTGKFHTDLRPRSSISKYNLVLANSIGLIDRGYKNQVLVRFKYIWNPEDYSISGDIILGAPNLNKIYNKGDKICQLVPMETHDIDFQVMEYLDGEDRGGGFGSTDKVPHQAPARREEGFKLRQKTTIEKGLPADMWANASFRLMRHDGEIYSCTEKGIPGICVVDSSGQVLDKFFV
jgi:dUTP pyrophosphatase